MPRTKYPEITEQRILDAATELFSKKGWDQTSVQDIVDKLGDLTRGAFYHHFKSKDDIIDAVLDRITIGQDPLKDVQKMISLNGLEKLRKAFLLSFENTTLIEAIKSGANVLTEPRFVAKQVKNIPVSSRDILLLINEGIADDSIHVKHPEQVAQTYMLLTNVWLSPIIFPASVEECMQKALHLQEMYSSIGLPVIDDNILETLKNFYSNV